MTLALAVMRDAERVLAAVEDQRHDQVFLVVEMADQPLDQRAARLRVIVAAALQRVGIAQLARATARWRCPRSPPCRRGWHGGRLPARRSRAPAAHRRRGRSENNADPRSGDARRAATAGTAAAAPAGAGIPPPAFRPARNCASISSIIVGELAKHVVARQPEPRHLAEIGVALPLLARKARDQHAQILRPAAAAGQRERLDVGGAGGFDGHGSLR